MDLLIADCRTEEAREWAERMRGVEDTYHYEMYMGHICRAECKLAEALEWWQKMTARRPEHWIVWVEYASCMAKIGRYDEAIVYYKKAMPMRPKPRFTDCEDAVSQICEMHGDYEEAIAMQEQMLAITKEDWGDEGESVDMVLREIKRLRALCK